MTRKPLAACFSYIAPILESLDLGGPNMASVLLAVETQRRKDGDLWLEIHLRGDQDNHPLRVWLAGAPTRTVVLEYEVGTAAHWYRLGPMGPFARVMVKVDVPPI